MANGNFIVQNGLQVGPLTIDAATGSISTSGNVSITGNLGVSQISKNDSSIAINDTGTGSSIVTTIDGVVATTVDATGVKLPSGDAFYINGTSVLNATTLGSGVTASSLTSVGTLTGLTLSGTLTGTTVNAATIGNTGTAFTGASISAATIGNASAVHTGATMTLTSTLNAAGTATVNALVANADVTVGGNLTVNGTTVTVNATALTVNDKNIIVANNQSTSSGIDGAGIDAGGGATPIATWRYNNATTSWQSNVAIMPAATNTLTLGGSSNYWNNIYSTTHTGTTGTFSGTVTAATVNAATIGNSGAALTGTIQTAAQTNITSVGLLSALSVSGAINSGTSVTAPSFTSNVATGTAPLTVASTTLVSNLNADLWDGNHFGTYLNQAVLTTSSPTFAGVTLPSITKNGTTGTGDIGQSGNTFGTVYAVTFSGVSTTAKYADLAENYSADAEYEPGTVLMFGGEAEVTLCELANNRRVAGVVTTAPAYLMNSELEGTKAAIALQGRVPCKVVGPVRKGDMMVSAGSGRAKAEDNPQVGAVIGKALENFDGQEGVIEVVVGRV